MKPRIVRHTIINTLGSIIPVCLSLITIPLIIKGYGLDRYGVLAIVFILAGYFGFFDFGLGRATTRFMAKAWQQEDEASAAGYFWLSLVMNFCLGLCGGMILATAAPWLVAGILKVPMALKQETLQSFYWLSLSIPLITMVSSLIGALESRNHFGLINTVQISVDSAMKCAPLALLPFTDRLDRVIGVFFVIRLASGLLYLLLCLNRIPALSRHIKLKKSRLKKLLNFGGWLTITNIIGPLMTYIDRFVIGSLISMRAVTFYSAPYDIMRKLQIIPLGVSRTLFPIFGAGSDDSSGPSFASLYIQSIKYLIILLVPIVVCIAGLAQYLLELWLGSEFATHSVTVLRILVLGAFVNALAKPPYVFIQGIGRPDITAKFHMLEFPFYLIMLLCFMPWFGIIGAAIAWTLRIMADTALLQYWATQHIKHLNQDSLAGELAAIEGSAILTIAISLGISFLDNMEMQLWCTCILVILFLVWSWFILLNRNDRLYLNAISTNWLRYRPPARSD